MADILAVCKLEQPDMEGFRVGEGRPVIAKYMDQAGPEAWLFTFYKILR